MSEPGRQPGIDCPRCGHLFQITIPLLLANGAVFCSGCGLELRLDHEASRGSLESLNRLNQRLGEIKAERSHELSRYRTGNRT